jgi:hypothetical protein
MKSWLSASTFQQDDICPFSCPGMLRSELNTLYSPDLSIAGFSLFERLKQQFPGRTLESEENVPETVTEILNQLQNDVKSVLLHWKE